MLRLITLTVIALLPLKAHAVTAGDVLDRMDADERFGFMNGALDMLAYELSRAGQGDKTACVYDWYFRGNGPSEVVAVFDNHKDLPAVAIIRTLADRHCQ